MNNLKVSGSDSWTAKYTTRKGKPSGRHFKPGPPDNSTMLTASHKNNCSETMPVQKMPVLVLNFSKGMYLAARW